MKMKSECMDQNNTNVNILDLQNYKTETEKKYCNQYIQTIHISSTDLNYRMMAWQWEKYLNKQYITTTKVIIVTVYVKAHFSCKTHVKLES